MGNLLANPGFETGKEPWFSMTTDVWVPDFELSQGVAHAGEAAALLRVDADQDTPPTQIWGVSQFVNPEAFPTRLAGWYRVDDWVAGDANQYVQAVMIVWGPSPDGEHGNHQIRYLLGGADEPPFHMPNARYVGVGTELPPAGEWASFEFAPAADFQRIWGRIPTEYDRIQVFFEARFDRRQDRQDPVGGRVYFDDLYVGE
ncbi:hypothetical protein GF314_06590 [bacterium]|nr:hypothetical protein [bacterium]